MTIPVQITFRGVDASHALRTTIEEHAQRLERFSKIILGCHVVVEHAEQHHQKGNRFRVRVHLKVAGRDIQASRGPGRENKSYEDIYVAVRDVFDAVRRQLEEHERTHRGDVKAHATPAHGRVEQIYRDADYGVIRTSDGREIHFHRNSVVDTDFDKLVTGREVRFSEVPGEEGPWASTVHLVGKHHPLS